MSKTTVVVDLAAQLKAFYKTGYKYTNYILLVVFEYIIRLYSKLERLFSLLLLVYLHLLGLGHVILCHVTALV